MKNDILQSLRGSALQVFEKYFSGRHSFFVTLDDDLLGTENEVKTLSNRKDDMEGHIVDVLAESIFRILIALRFRRSGEK